MSKREDVEVILSRSSVVNGSRAVGLKLEDKAGSREGLFCFTFLIYWPGSIIQDWQTGVSRALLACAIVRGEYCLEFNMGWYARSLPSFIISKP